MLTALRALSAGEKVALAVDIENGRARLALASPVKVRGRLAGFLVGVLDFEGCLERLFSAVLRSTGRFLCVLGESGVLASLGESQGPAHFPLEAVGQPPGVVATLDMTRDRGAESFLVLDLPVGGASLRLRYLAPSRSVYGLVPPWITSTVISVLCALTLAGLALVWRSNAERLVLNARLAEQARSEADLRQRMEEFRTVFDGAAGHGLLQGRPGPLHHGQPFLLPGHGPGTIRLRGPHRRRNPAPGDCGADEAAGRADPGEG